MVWPIIPILLAGTAGTAAGALVSNLLDGGDEIHAPYETFAPQITHAPISSIQYPDYQIQIDSPAAIQTSKKEMRVDPTISPVQQVMPGMETTEGIPIIPIALIGGAALVVMSYVGKKK